VKFLFLLYSHEARLQCDGGGFRKPWLLAENLTRLGHEVNIISPSVNFNSTVEHRTFEIPDLPIVRPVWANILLLIFGLNHSLRDRPDAVYFRSSLTMIPALISWLIGAKLLMEINGDAVSEEYRDGHPIRAWLTNIIEHINCKIAHHIFVLTEGLSAVAQSRYGVPARRISVVPSASDPSHFRPLDPVECRKILGIPPNRLTVGFMGILYRHQGVDKLLQAAPEIIRAVPETQFLIIGDGPARAELEALAKKLGITEHFKFAGQIPYDSAPTAVGAIDIAVAPFAANRGETSPLKIFDYLACGKPVVATRIPAIEALQREIDSLILVPPDSGKELAATVIKLLKDAEMRKELGGKGRRYVEQTYNWQSIAERYMQPLMLETEAADKSISGINK
jgi:glycosyltransferase involved in cell wall biosynthesis